MIPWSAFWGMVASSLFAYFRNINFLVLLMFNLWLQRIPFSCWFWPNTTLLSKSVIHKAFKHNVLKKCSSWCKGHSYDKQVLLKILSSVLLWFFLSCRTWFAQKQCQLLWKKSYWSLMGVVFHIPNVFTNLFIRHLISLQLNLWRSKGLLSGECSEGLCS